MRELKMLTGRPPRVIFHQVHWYTKRNMAKSRTKLDVRPSLTSSGSPPVANASKSRGLSADCAPSLTTCRYLSHSLSHSLSLSLALSLCLSICLSHSLFLSLFLVAAGLNNANLHPQPQPPNSEA